MPIPTLTYTPTFLTHSPSIYTSSQMSILNTACTLLDAASKASLTNLKSSNPTVKMYSSKGGVSKIFEKCEYKWWNNSTGPPNKLFVSSATILAPPSYILAFCCDFMNQMRVQFNKTSDLDRCIIRQDSEHCFTSFNRRWMPKPFLHRDFLSSHVWKRLDDRRIIYVVYDSTSEDYPPTSNNIGVKFNKNGSIRANCFVAMLIESTVDDRVEVNEIFHNAECRLVIDIDPGGTMPKHLRSVSSHRGLSFMNDCHNFFKAHQVSIQKHREACDRDGSWKSTVILNQITAGQQQPRLRIDKPDTNMKNINYKMNNIFVDWLKDEGMPADTDIRAKQTMFDPMLAQKQCRYPFEKCIFNLPFEDEEAEAQFIDFEIRQRQSEGAKQGGLTLILSIIATTVPFVYFSRTNEADVAKKYFLQSFCVLLVPLFTDWMIFKEKYADVPIKNWKYADLTITICSIMPYINFCLTVEPWLAELQETEGRFNPLAIAIVINIIILFRVFTLMNWQHTSKALLCLHFFLCVYITILSPIIYTWVEMDATHLKDYRVRFFGVLNIMLAFNFYSVKSVNRTRRSLFSHYWFRHSAHFLHKKEIMSRFELDKKRRTIIQKVLDQIKGRAVRKQLADLLKMEINYSDLNYLHEVGRGGNGVVFAASYRNQIVAVKQIIPNMISAESIMSLIGEMQFGVMLNHPNLVKTIGCCLTAPHICCVLELASEGSLREKMRREITLDWVNGKRNFARDIVAGMCYLHEREKPILHRDLKSGNVLITAWHEAKISDFGSSRVMPENLGDLSVEVGTKFFMAPEVMSGDSYGTPSDVYSFGCLLADMAMQGEVKELYMRGQNAPKNPLEFMNQIVSGWRPQLPSKWKYQLNLIYDTIQECWRPIPAERPTFKALFAKFEAWNGELDINASEESTVLRHMSPYSEFENEFLNEGFDFMSEAVRKIRAKNEAAKRKEKELNPLPPAQPKPENTSIEGVLNSQNNPNEVQLNNEFDYKTVLMGSLGPDSRATGFLTRTLPFQAHEVMDYLIDWAAPFKQCLKVEKQGVELAREIKHYYNEHHQIFQLVKVLGAPLKPRELIMRSIWKQMSQGVYILWNHSCDHASSPPGEYGSIRATGKSGMLVQEVPGENSCHVTYSFSVESFGGMATVPYHFRNFFKSSPLRKAPLKEFLVEIEVYLRLKRGEDLAEIERGMEGNLPSNPNFFTESFEHHQKIVRQSSSEDYDDQDMLNRLESGETRSTKETAHSPFVGNGASVRGTHTHDKYYTAFEKQESSEGGGRRRRTALDQPQCRQE
ncbi:hypothetical protein TL16_g02077 [Triparma laevis f. inornata]|uniref:Uncharacterized protein n=1 Tax=Triparma laevis f. inornata TaxID=1714386 RepID=A0A9W6ZRQ8_9STRA|nr:hypothetical protein TL16_g02077 [Triparma laevis f. inornata]